MPETSVDNALSLVDVLVPRGGKVADLQSAPDWAPFNDDVLDFVGDFSRSLMKTHAARAFPEIISLAHWMRPKALLELAEQYRATLPPLSVAMSRGIALHFAPGNVDTIFLYSALLSILSGNRNIVRISQRHSPQIELMIEVLNELLDKPKHQALRSRLMIVRYGHDETITATLSKICDLRVIWGGDETVMAIRSIPLAPRARDISFPNRWSLAVLDAAELLEQTEENLAKLALGFANDAYWFGQMACSSPRLVLWHGSSEDAKSAAGRFWPAIGTQAERFANEIAPVNFVNKLVSQDIAAIEGQISAILPLADNVVSVGEMIHPGAPDDDLCVGEGLFWNAQVQSLDEIAPLLDIKSQTIASFGVSGDDWQHLVIRTGAKIDRIVPIGQALQFGHIWDGMNLLTEFTRLIRIEV